MGTLALALTVDMDEYELITAIDVAWRVWGITIVDLHIERPAGWLVVLKGSADDTYTGGDEAEAKRLLATAL